MSLLNLNEDTNRKVIIFSAEVFNLYNVLPISEAQKQLFQPRGFQQNSLKSSYIKIKFE